MVDDLSVAPLQLEATATASSVGVLRRRLRRWLSEAVEAGEQPAEDLCLAVSEALENAADHAFIDQPVGTVTLEAHHYQGQRPSVTVTVTDDGHWQPMSDPGYRGRGLKLIRALTSYCRLEAGPQGTRLTLQCEL